MDTIGLPAPAAQQHPSAVPGYRILRLLGEGGMGQVYLAEQAHPSRQVALKLMRGLHAQARERFRREAELLAALEHPGIARLYAAGEAEFGGVRVPWLSMEYVEGDDLVTHARERSPDLRQRLQLLLAVCRAVQHAHARGIVHRDLKPGNILVDAEGRPRVLDFGIARLLDEQERMTEQGQLLGTLAYMSPERLQQGGDTGPGADVYALGVIAYELVASRLPLPRLTTSTLFEALEIVRRDTPPALASVAPQARGDLDCVVMKALASDPQRRYASVAEFAADIERVLDHRPVQARPPSAAYLAARFVRRHRVASVAALLAACVLVAASVVSLRFALAEAEARRQAEDRAAEAAAVNAFLERMLTAADPAQAQGQDPSVSSVLEQAEAELPRSGLSPAARRAVLATLTDTRAALGHYPRALALNDEALAVPGGNDAGLQARLLRRRGTVLTELGRFDEAGQALAAARAAMPASAAAEQRLGLALSAARLQNEEGDLDAAEAGYRDILAQLATLPADAGGELAGIELTTRSNLSALLRDRGALDEALAQADAVLALRLQQHGERDPRTLATRHKRALVLDAIGRHDAAATEARAVLALQREVLGPQHLATLTTLQSLANALLAQQQLDEAEALSREALAGLEAQLGHGHAQTVASMNTLAYLLEERGKLDEAEQLYRDILVRLQGGGTLHPETLGPRNNLAMLLLTAGRHGEARVEFEALLADTTAIVGEAHPYHAIFSSNYGLCLHRAGALRQAAGVLESARSRLASTLGADHARTQVAAERLDTVYAALQASGQGR